MDAAQLMSLMAPLSVNTLKKAPPVPVCLGRWELLWLQYAVADPAPDAVGEKDGAEKDEATCRVAQACLFDAAGARLDVPVAAEVRLGRAALAAPTASSGALTYADYLAWACQAAGAGAPSAADALTRAGRPGLLPLYEAALDACAKMLEKGGVR